VMFRSDPTRFFRHPQGALPGLAKARLQNYFAGMACNVKRWLNRKAWELSRAAAAMAPGAC